MNIIKNRYSPLFIGLLLICFSSVAQRDLTHRKKNKRTDVFGGALDVRSLKNYGLQINGGPTYQFTRLHSTPVYDDNDGRPFDYTITPKGRLGLFFDIGTAHFPISTPKFTFIKKRFISYYDWGFGAKLLRGKESVDITYVDGNTSHGEGALFNGYVSLRGTAHKNIYFKEKYFLDNGIGVNLDYRFMNNPLSYTKGVQSPAIHSFHEPFIAQIHFEIGLGIKKRRGTYIIPGIQIPILGIAGNAAPHWFSSNYWPILFKVKYINLFEKKKSKTSCNQGSEDDRKRNKEFMQGQ